MASKKILTDLHVDGKVGVGTTTPDEQLHVEGNAVFLTNGSSGNIKVGRDTNQHVAITVADLGTEIKSIQDSDSNASHYFKLNRDHLGSGADDFKIQKDGDDQLVIDKDGNVGIGISSPNAKLDVTDFVDGNETYINAGLGVTNPTRFKVYNESYKGALSLYDDGNTEDVKITTGGASWFNGGNVGIGTNSPGHKLAVLGGNIQTDGNLYTNIIRDNTGGNVSIQDNGGNVGIGTTSPGTELEVRGKSQTDTSIGQATNYATSIGWVEDSQPMSSQVGYFGGVFSKNGDSSEQEIAYGLNPFGQRKLIWNTLGDTENGPDGGWTKNITNLPGSDYGYMSIVYFKINQSLTTGDPGNIYHGCASTTTYNVDSDTENTNPYFVAKPIEDFTVGIWYVSIGIIQSNGDPNTILSATSFLGGIYEVNTGKKVNNNTYFKMESGATSQVHRAFQYYTTDEDLTVSFSDPGFYTIDGSEPKLNELLNLDQSSLTSGSGTDNYVVKWDGTEGLQDSLIYDNGTNVGVGTNSPSYNLDVSSSENVIANFESSTNKGAIRISDEDTTAYISAENGRIGFGTSGQLSSSNITMLTSNNYVGIGTSSPLSKLMVEGSDSTEAGILTLANRSVADNSRTGIEFINSSVDESRAGIYAQRVDSGYNTELSFNTGQSGSIERMRIDSTGNVGIGTTSPNDQLTINPDTSGKGLTIRNFGNTLDTVRFNSFGVASTLDMLNNNVIKAHISTAGDTFFNGGNVGIGTETPSVELEVDGSWKLKGIDDGHFESFAAGTQLDISEKDSGGWARSHRILTSDSSGSVFSGVFGNDTTTTRAYWTIGDPSSDSSGYTHTTGVHLLKNGNVGIGTTNPSEKLEIAGTIMVPSGGGAWGTSSGGVQLNYNSGTSQGHLTTYNDSTSLVLGAGVSQKTGVTINGQANTSGNNIFFRVGNSERMRIDSTGNVGIGTTSPDRQLEIESSDIGTVAISGVNGSKLYFRPNTSYTAGGNFGIETTGLTSGTFESTMNFTGFSSAITTPMTIKGSGNVGIGTTSPSEKLDIQGNITAYNTYADGVSIKLKHSLQYPGSIIKSIVDQTGDTQDSGSSMLRFYTNDNSTTQPTVALDLTSESNAVFYGNVGIGTSSPQHKLDVDGDLKISGDLYSLYHKVEVGKYYFDTYSGARNLNAFLKSQRADIIKYRSISDVEYWNGSSWVDGSSQINNVKKLLDGRKDTFWSVPSTYYKFRFTVEASTSYPTTALIGTETSWSGSSFPGFQMLVEELQSDNTTWVTEVTANFTSSNGNTNWGTSFIAKDDLHTGRSTTRITIDFDGWSPSNASYNTIPLQNIFIYSNYGGIENNDYHNLLDYDRNVTAPSKLNIATVDTSASSVTALVLDGTEVTKRTLGSAAFLDITNNVDGSGTTNYVTKWTDADTIGDSVIYDDGTNVGIGTTSPSYKLDVIGISRFKGDSSVSNHIEINGGSNANGNLAQISSRYNGISIITNAGAGDPHIKMLPDTGGNVGIGTSSPTAKLMVAGSDNSWLIKAESNGVNDSGLYADSSGNIDLYLRKADGDIGVLANPNGSSYFNGGNVGIGNTNPAEKLHVNGNIRAGDGTTQDGIVKAYYNDGSHTRMHGYGLYFDRGESYIRPTSSGDKNLNIGHTTNVWNNLKIDSELIKINSMAGHESEGQIRFGRYDGNTTRYNRLTNYVSSTEGSNYMQFEIHNGTENSTVEVMTLKGNGNVGIGTASPSDELHVIGDIQASQTSKAIKFQSIATDAGVNTLQLGRSDNNSYWNVNHAGNDFRLWNSDGAGTDILFSINSGSSDTSNKVGIGTATPTEKLDVNGNVKADSFIKDGGTSSQFLKADGSVDSNTYISSSTGDWTGTFDGQEGTYYLDYNNFTNTPTIPTNNNELTNGAGYVTSSGNTIIGTDSDISTTGSYVLDTLVMTDGVVTSHGTRKLKQLSSIDDRDMAPEDVDYTVDFATYFSSKGGLDTGTTANSDYQDVLLLNTYSDSSGGDANILSFDKSEKKIYHYQADQSATNWGTPEVLAYVSDVPTNNNQLTNGAGYLTNADIGSYVDGSGSAGKIAKWTDSDSIEDSIITEVSSEIGIGVASPKAKLHVDGAVIVGDDQTTNQTDLAAMKGAIRYWEESAGGGITYSYCDMVMLSGCNYAWVNIVTNKNQCI